MILFLQIFFLYTWIYLLQTTERLNVFFKKINILVFLNFLCLLETLQYILNYLDFMVKKLILFCHPLFIRRIDLYTLINFYILTWIDKSNTKVSTNYWIINLYSINICYNIFISYELFNFFWNMFNSKAIKVCYINRIYI